MPQAYSSASWSLNPVIMQSVRCWLGSQVKNIPGCCVLSIFRLCFYCVSSYLKLVLLVWFHGADVGAHSFKVHNYSHSVCSYGYRMLCFGALGSAGQRSSVGDHCPDHRLGRTGQESRCRCCFCSSLCPLGGVTGLDGQVHLGIFFWKVCEPCCILKMSVAHPLWMPYLFRLLALRKKWP